MKRLYVPQESVLQTIHLPAFRRLEKALPEWTL